MTKNTLLACLLSCLAGVSASHAITPGGTANATIALVASETAPGFKIVEDGETFYEFEKFTSKEKGGVTTLDIAEEKGVIGLYRFGNVQILAMMLEEGSLPDTTIGGWSIISVTGTGEEGSFALYAVKKGKTPIPLNFSLDITAAVAAYARKHTHD
jgi:hypothetical protein